MKLSTFQILLDAVLLYPAIDVPLETQTGPGLGRDVFCLAVVHLIGLQRAALAAIIV